MYKYVLVIYLVLSGLNSFGQFFQTPSYPSGDFRNPLDIPISLAANFGELRANHYHMGLDIRTAHRENLPVYAVAAGYICRIKIEPFGFGQAIYIHHTNGYISLYAHLNAFYPALATYIKQKQYEKELWDINIELPPGLLNVKKGDLIAYSGNMGGSQGPHLHFEIRTYPEDINLNPLLFGLPVADQEAPVLRSMSVYDRNKSFYEQAPVFYPLKGSGGRFTISSPLLLVKSASPGFGISGFDTQSGSGNPNGIFQAVLYQDGIPLSGFQMDRISYNDTRGINAHIDYPTREKGGPYYQLLFKLPGYSNSIYKEANPGAFLHLEDGKIHEIRIEVKDAYGNTSNLAFSVKYQPVVEKPSSYLGRMFYPGMMDGYETPDAAFYLGEKSLYDSLHVNIQEISSNANPPDVISSLFSIGNKEVPLADMMTVRIRLQSPYIPKQKVLVQWLDDKDFEVKKPEWLGEWATCTFRTFGIFRLVLDTIPPLINLPGMVENGRMQRSSKIVVLIEDNFDKIKNFRAMLDGKWLLFTNDKARAFIYHLDERCSLGKHELKIYAEDEAGNSALKVLHFIQ